MPLIKTNVTRSAAHRKARSLAATHKVRANPRGGH
jgi:hypothetical protein